VLQLHMDTEGFQWEGNTCLNNNCFHGRLKIPIPVSSLSSICLVFCNVVLVMKQDGPEKSDTLLFACESSKMLGVVPSVHFLSWCKVWANFNHRPKLTTDKQTSTCRSYIRTALKVYLALIIQRYYNSKQQLRW
jgi:hypothetical protein